MLIVVGLTRFVWDADHPGLVYLLRTIDPAVSLVFLVMLGPAHDPEGAI